MQQTLTLLAGDSKERENKGGGWKTKSEEKGGEWRRGRATSSPDFTWAEGDKFFHFSIQLPLAVFSLFVPLIFVPRAVRSCRTCTGKQTGHTCQCVSAPV